MPIRLGGFCWTRRTMPPGLHLCGLLVLLLQSSLSRSADAVGHVLQPSPSINIEISVVTGGVARSASLAFACTDSPLNSSQAFCVEHSLQADHCNTLQQYAFNKYEAACGTGLGGSVPVEVEESAFDMLPVDTSFGGYGQEPLASTPPDDTIINQWRASDDINQRLARLVMGPWQDRGVGPGDVDDIITAEPECIIIQYLAPSADASGGVYVSSPSCESFEREKWFLYQRRHDAIRLIDGLARVGRLGNASWELAFCPRDCPTGGTVYNYSGMPPQRGSTQVLPVFGLVACKGSMNIPLHILSRRTADFVDKQWDDVVRVLRDNRRRYPWAERQDRAIFRGAVYGRSCWNGEVGQTVAHQDTIRCGRPRLLWLTQDQGGAGRGLDVKFEFQPLLHQETAKLQIQVEGHCGWADRAQFLLHMGSAMVLQETMCRQWFLLLLEPWVHYLPLHYHMTNLLPLLDWAWQADSQPLLQQMVENMHAYADAVLSEQGMQDYTTELLHGYATAMRYEVEAPRPGALSAAEFLELHREQERIP